MFEIILDNTPQRSRNAITLTQWSSLFKKCAQHSAALEPLLHKMAGLLALPSFQPDERNIGTTLYNLQNMTASGATDAVLHAMVPHIKQIRQLDPQAIGMSLYGLQNMTASGATDAVLHAMVPHIKQIRQLAPQAIGNALYGLQNMTARGATDAVLRAMVPHITQVDQLSPQEIGMSLYGLQNMTASGATDAVLRALARYAEKFGGGDALGGPFIYLVEALHSLKGHRHNESGQLMLNTLSRQLQVAIPDQPLSTIEYRNTLYDLLKKAGHIHPNSQDRSVLAINLHGLSHGLGFEFCSIALNVLMKTNRTVDVVYGASTHIAANQDKMRQQVERALAQFHEEVMPIIYQFREGMPYVRVVQR